MTGGRSCASMHPRHSFIRVSRYFNVPVEVIVF